jgi:hypothetical protein
LERLEETSHSRTDGLFDTFGNHGLDGEGVPGLHDADGLVLGVVRDVGSAVEQLVDS